MTYVRQRTTNAGAVSTALVEAYRDEQGRPRQRLLANLYGEPDALRALAKLAAQRDILRKEKDRLAPEVMKANQVYETITQNVLLGHQYNAAERKEIDGIVRLRARLAKRLLRIEGALTSIEKDGAVIKKHCSSTPEEIQAAIRDHQRARHDAECLVLGMEFAAKMQLKEANAKLRRLSICPEKTDTAWMKNIDD